jgi:hypothetical protein
LLQVARKDQGLGQLATELLHVDKNCRLSACALTTKLRQQQRQPQEEAAEQTAAAEAKAKAEAAAKSEQEEAAKQKAAAAVHAPPPPASLELPEGWKEYQDKKTGKPYYHHAATNHTTWDRPAKVAQERADAELAKKLQMQLQLQAAGSSPAASSAPSQPPPLSKPASTPDNERKLLEAAKDGDTTTAVSLLTAGTNVHCRGSGLQWRPVVLDKNGWTPLHWAARNNRLEVAQVLLAHGADVNARDDKVSHWGKNIHIYIYIYIYIY